MIKIFDNRLSDSLLKACIEEAETSQNYGVLHRIGDGTQGFKYNWMFCDPEDQGHIKSDNLRNLWIEVQKQIHHKFCLRRAYINAHTYGVEDCIHTDDPEFNNGVTVIVYLCSGWHSEWFGQTLFFNSSGQNMCNEIIQSVMPRFNRILIFDKNIPHCVSPLSRRFVGVRLTCMFKVELLDASA